MKLIRNQGRWGFQVGRLFKFLRTFFLMKIGYVKLTVRIKLMQTR